MKEFVWYYRKIIITIIFTLLAWYACTHTTLAQSERIDLDDVCDYETPASGAKFAVLNHGRQSIPGVSTDDLSAVDDYLRSIYEPRSRYHILGFYATSSDVTPYIGYERDWSNYSGLTTLVRWSWLTCTEQRDSWEHVQISLMRTGVFDDATFFGLFAHEISHANGEDRHTDEYRSSVYWERVGKSAYLNTCDALAYTDRADCQEIVTRIGA